MNMSFGGVAVPTPSSSGGGGGEDPPPSSSAPSAPVPSVPPSFSLSSATFTFQGSSPNLMPLPQPAFAPSSGFSFPGPQSTMPPSSGPPTLPFPSSGPALRFPYPGPPTNALSLSAPPSTSPASPFSMPFSYKGSPGNPPPLSGVASGPPSFAISNVPLGFSGQSPSVHARPPAQMAIIGMPSTTTPQSHAQAPQGPVSGAQMATQPAQAQSMHGAGPSPPPQVSGTPTGQSSTSLPPQPPAIQGPPATAAHILSSGPAAVPSTTPGMASISVSLGTGTSVATEEAMSHQSARGGFPPHPAPAPLGTQMRPSIPTSGMAASLQVMSVFTQPQGQGAAGMVHPAIVPPTTVVLPTTMLPVQVLPGQMPVTTLLSPVGAVPARPGPIVPSSTSMPFVPPRPVFSTNHVAAAVPLVPSGVLGSAPAGMAPRFSVPPFAPMVRPSNFPRPPSPLARPPPGTVLRPGTLVRPHPLLEKPQTLVYVGKIASTVDDDFLRSLLELCGPIKSWKRAHEPAVGSFGFCEFESPEGVLRALRQLNGFSLEGRELKLTVTHATREYLERYVQKKEREQQMKLEASQAIDTEVETAPGVEAPEPVKKPVAEVRKNDPSTEEQGSDEKRFGIINDEDKEVDDEVQKKLTILLEERARLMPLPPPPPLPSASDAPGNSNSMSDTPAKSRDGDSVADGGKTDGQEGINEEDTSENKGNSELDRPETSSSDRGRRLDHYRGRDMERERDRDRDKGRDRESRDRDRERERERERKRSKEWELEQMERDKERSRARRERERELRMRDAERIYEDCERAWEEREKEKERLRNVDRDKEKEGEKQRRRLIKEQEEDSDDEGWKKWKRRGDPYGERKRIQREREDDEKDHLKEEEEILDAKQRKLKEDYEEQVKKRLAEIAQTEAAEVVLDDAEGGSVEPEATKNAEGIVSESKEENHILVVDGEDNNVSTNGICDMVIDEEGGNAPVSMEMDEKRNSSPAPKKLGFGLMGAGKRTAVPSVFHPEDEEEAPKDRGLRQLVPIDYTAEEMHAVLSLKANTTLGSAAPNLAAAAEFAKSLWNLGNSSLKEELELERDRARRHSEKSKDKNHWDEGRSKDRERGDRDEMGRSRDRDKDKHRHSDGNREKDHLPVKLDTKQLIDTIPKTKDELFAYRIDWKIYDEHELHERMRPWIQKKITEFLGEEEDTLVDFVVSNTKKHASAASMLELLTTILDDEAEMFVMKMWRMLIFEIKKVETGLLSKPKA